MAVLLVTSGLSAGVARADQFIVTDLGYTHAKDNTTDSHYRVDPLPGTPSNWKSPVDYSNGSVHVVLEVKTKPSDAPTRFQVCFEGTPDAACSEQGPTYTKTGTYAWTSKFSAFWSAKGGPDWSKGGGKIALILKDTNNGKPQGDPKYVPTELHVTVAVLSGNATFVPPAATPDGGLGDAAGKPAPVRPDAGSAADAASGAPPPPPSDAATSSSEPHDAGTSAPRKDAATSSAASDAGSREERGADDDAGGGSVADKDKDKGGGCSVGSASWSGGLPSALASLLLLLLTVARRSRRQPAARRVFRA